MGKGIDPKFGPLAERAFHAYQGFVDSFADKGPAPRVQIFGTEVHGGVIYYPFFFILMALLLMTPWIAHQVIVKPMMPQGAKKAKPAAKAEVKKDK
mmetsp:Transcript_6150/g.13642  ORF Transcript_6150/g.13642 Transcript_6150/m.13642 type:complete len:96 (-) Transcript_6150:28-315(-)